MCECGCIDVFILYDGHLLVEEWNCEHVRKDF